MAATVTTAATVAVLLVMASEVDIKALLAVPGLLVTAVATMGSGMDPNARHHVVTIALMPVPAGIGLVLGTLVHGRPLLTAAAFMGLGVVTLAASLAGVRGTLLALAAIAAFYGAGLVAVPAARLPIHLSSIVVGAAVSVLGLGVVFRERPEALPARLMRSVGVLAVRAGSVAGNGKAVRGALDSFAFAVASTRAHIEAHPRCWPGRLRFGAGAELGSFEVRLADAVAEVRAGGDPAVIDRLLVDPVLADPLPDGAASRKPFWRRRSVGGDVDSAPMSAAPLDNTAAPSTARGGRGQVAMAVQLLVAAALAVTVSMLIDPQRWFWGVLAALVPLFGTSSAADAVGKGIGRVLGTAAALPVGSALVALTENNLAAVVAYVVVAVFLQQYLADVAYGWSVFFLTVFLYLAFALSGPSADDVLAVRLAQTAAGAAIGIAVALFVLPTRSGALLRGRAVDLADAVDTAMDRITSGRPADEVDAAVRESHQRLLRWRADAAASRQGWPFSHAHQAVDVQLDEAAAVVHDLRALAVRYRDGHDGDADADP
ncbi:FUSC family protein [Lentzea sp. NPDC092896]|uniref:FUSC family protein n=1 Tax=Lentzea sp. NPDC092896 TaxID=3364127 RepID=UPI00381A483F